MSTFVLKLLAIIFMLIDHIGAILVSPYTDPDLYLLLRSIGRLAFPIFVFLIVEGSFHTKDIKKYLKRLGIFALISEIPFDIAFYHFDYNSDVISDIQAIFTKPVNSEQLEVVINRFNAHQNVFFTLFLGLLLIYFMQLVEKKYEKQLLYVNIIDALLTLVFCAVAFFLKTDYGFPGILMIVAFYLFRGSKLMLSLSLFIICGTVIGSIPSYQQTGNVLYLIPMLATLAMIPIAFYNGKKGRSIKYFFYIFYPAHLLLLFLIFQFIL